MQTDLDYIAHLARESARFAAVIGVVPADARVPSCPDWNADGVDEALRLMYGGG